METNRGMKLVLKYATEFICQADFEDGFDEKQEEKDILWQFAEYLKMCAVVDFDPDKPGRKRSKLAPAKVPTNEGNWWTRCVIALLVTFPVWAFSKVFTSHKKKSKKNN